MEGRSASAVARAVATRLPEVAPIFDAVPVPKGHGHECWRVDGASRTVMLKLALRGATAVSMANLAEALRLAGKGGVPAPRLLWTGTAPAELGERRMLIQEFLPGLDGEEALESLNSEARANFFRDWGAAVGRLHSVRPPCFSSSISEPSRCLPTWAAMIEERLERMVVLNREAEVLSDRRLDEASEQVLTEARRVTGLVRPALIHGDLYPPNTLVNRGRFSAILDFEHARSWDQVHDFVKLKMWTFERHEGSEAPFLEGYYSTAPAIQSFEERLIVCTGLELLAGFPYWKKHGEEEMLADYLARFDEWHSIARIK